MDEGLYPQPAIGGEDDQVRNTEHNHNEPAVEALTMLLTEGRLAYDEDGNVWRLHEPRLIASGTVLTTRWDYVFTERDDPDDDADDLADAPPLGAVRDNESVEFAGRRWHEVDYNYCLVANYNGGPYMAGMRCIIYEVVPTTEGHGN